jgi:formylglycine-generating enzyme required for sulfatase activity
MAGNVWEWTADLLEAYPGGDAGLFSNYGDDYRVVRGGAWISRGEIPHVMSFERSASLITKTNEVLGFRCAKSVP